MSSSTRTASPVPVGGPGRSQESKGKQVNDAEELERGLEDDSEMMWRGACGDDAIQLTGAFGADAGMVREDEFRLRHDDQVPPQRRPHQRSSTTIL